MTLLKRAWVNLCLRSKEQHSVLRHHQLENDKVPRRIWRHASNKTQCKQFNEGCENSIEITIFPRNVFFFLVDVLQRSIGKRRGGGAYAHLINCILWRFVSWNTIQKQFSVLKLNSCADKVPRIPNKPFVRHPLLLSLSRSLELP